MKQNSCNCRYDWSNPPEYLVEWARAVGYKQCDKIQRERLIGRICLAAMAFILLLALLIAGCNQQPVWADEIDNIIPCIIEVESHGNPNAVSPCGAIGLMQITPIVLKEYQQFKTKEFWGDAEPVFHDNMTTEQRFNYSLDNLRKPVFNKKVGEWYLRRLRNYYLKDVLWEKRDIKQKTNIGREVTVHLQEWRLDRELSLIFSAYNGGITRLRQVNYDINKMPRETREYVKKVMRCYKARSK